LRFTDATKVSTKGDKRHTVAYHAAMKRLVWEEEAVKIAMDNSVLLNQQKNNLELS